MTHQCFTGKSAYYFAQLNADLCSVAICSGDYEYMDSPFNINNELSNCGTAS